MELRTENERLRAALQEADTVMGHDDAETQWRERWAAMWDNVEPSGDLFGLSCRSETQVELLKTLALKVEVFGSADIEDACRDLCELASRIGVLCEAEFNGVTLLARPGDNFLDLAASWSEQMNRPHGHYKIAQVRSGRTSVKYDETDFDK